jgi:hypothetical protein
MGNCSTGSQSPEEGRSPLPAIHGLVCSAEGQHEQRNALETHNVNAFSRKHLRNKQESELNGDKLLLGPV